MKKLLNASKCICVGLFWESNFFFFILIPFFLCELDLGILNWVGEEEFKMKPAFREAFKAAKNVDMCQDDDYVERSEFRLLMIALR